ncbi:hypothetical protein TNCV_2829101 [Trichonephila clavipes]|nr:hypothetical protein TNCV_2829101 [Trichonephila clavipes]
MGKTEDHFGLYSRRYFNDCDTFDDRLPICVPEVEEIVDLSESMNRDSDAEMDNETPIKTVTFSVLYCLETENLCTEPLSYAAGFKSCYIRKCRSSKITSVTSPEWGRIKTPSGRLFKKESPVSGTVVTHVEAPVAWGSLSLIQW